MYIYIYTFTDSNVLKMEKVFLRVFEVLRIGVMFSKISNCKND